MSRIRQPENEEVAARVEERRRAIESARKKAVPSAKRRPTTVVLDTETTGLDPFADAILTVGVCDVRGAEVAYFEICPPPECYEWPSAEAVNGIAPGDTLDWPSLEDVRGELQGILDAAETVVCYNAGFDLAFLREAGFNVPADVVDVMLEFAPIYGERNGRRGGYRWQKLATCASYYGAPEFDAHNSLGDAQATAWCYSAMFGTASA